MKSVNLLRAGVSQAIDNVNKTIAPALLAKGFQVTQQTEIDNFMIALDGTENKSINLIPKC